MRKILTAVVLLMFVSASIVGQDANKAATDTSIKKAADATAELQKVSAETPWKVTGIVGFNGSSTNLWNWASGGNNTATGLLFGNVLLTYKKDRLAWITNVNTELGFSYVDGSLHDWQKANDKIDITSKFGYKLADKWYATTLGSFRSQYLKGYNYSKPTLVPNSAWLAPAYTDLSVGIDWVPNKYVTAYLSPIAGRLTTVTIPELRTNYGLTADQSNKFEAGATFKGGLNYTDIKNLKVFSALSLFTPYSEKFGNIDVDWDVAVSYQFLSVLNVTLSTSLKYYDAVLIADKAGLNPKQRIQFKTILGVGVAYSF